MSDGLGKRWGGTLLVAIVVAPVIGFAVSASANNYADLSWPAFWGGYVPTLGIWLVIQNWRLQRQDAARVIPEVAMALDVTSSLTPGERRHALVIRKRELNLAIKMVRSGAQAERAKAFVLPSRSS